VSYKLLTKKEVGTRIQLVKNDAIKEWLKTNRIEPITEGRTRAMYCGFAVELQIIVNRGRVVKLKYPDLWQDLICSQFGKDCAVTTSAVKILVAEKEMNKNKQIRYGSIIDTNNIEKELRGITV
jgi:hypothetical protein